MFKKLAVVAALVLFANSVQAVTFNPISSISSSTAGSDLWAASNLIQGSGVGFDATAPHNQLGAASTHRWVTAAPGGFPADYIAVAGTPVLTIDLGQDTLLSEISVWGYAASNANGVSEFSLRFATEAEGTGGFGTSIAFNPTYFPVNDDVLRQSFAFGQNLSARYVEFTAEDNFFIFPGDNSVNPPGGDRVGLGEIAFAVTVPEPASAALCLLGVASMGLIRRRRTS